MAEIQLGNYIIREVCGPPVLVHTYVRTYIHMNCVTLCRPASAQSLSSSSLQEELFCQLVNQTWCNDSPASRDRGWLLLALLTSCAHPSSRLEKYLIK